MTEGIVFPATLEDVSWTTRCLLAKSKIRRKAVCLVGQLLDGDVTMNLLRALAWQARELVHRSSIAYQFTRYALAQ